MKYLFYIHSAITELVSYHTIRETGLPEEDIVFLTNRNYKPNIKLYKSVDFIYDAYDSYFRGSKNLIKSWKRYREFNRYINSVVEGSDYYAYVPLTYPDFISLLIYNRKCTGYSIIEEGSFAYHPIEEVNTVYKMKRSFIWDDLGYFGTLRDCWFYNDDYDYVIGFSKDSFPGFKRRKILKRNNIVDFLKFNLKTNAAIIVLSAESIHGEVPLSCYKSALKAFINDHFKDKKDVNLYYKLHPAQVGSEEEQVYDSFFQQEPFPNIERLPNDVSLEFLAQNENGVSFFVTASSVALYAKLFGRDVYSYVDYLIEFCPGYEEEVKKIPELLLKNVVRLKPERKKTKAKRIINNT